MTAAAARSAPPDGVSTATALSPGCTASSADRDSSATSTRMRTIMGMNMASVKIACLELTVWSVGKHATVKLVDFVTEKPALVSPLKSWLK